MKDLKLNAKFKRKINETAIDENEISMWLSMYIYTHKFI